MISRFYQFDVKKFFAEYNYNKSRLISLQTDLAAIPLNGGVDYSRPVVQSNKISDMTFAKVSERELIQEKIAKLEAYFRLYDLIMSQLDEEEAILTDLYINSGSYTVDDISYRLGYSKTTIYQHLDALTRKIRSIVDFEVGKE